MLIISWHAQLLILSPRFTRWYKPMVTPPELNMFLTKLLLVAELRADTFDIVGRTFIASDTVDFTVESFIGFLQNLLKSKSIVGFS